MDIQSAMGQRAGVGRYTRSIVEHLGGLSGDDRLRVFYFDFRRRGPPFPISNAERRTVRWCPGRLMQKSWNILRRPAFDLLAGPADVYHFPNFIIPPLSRGRSVATVHDVSFLAHPEFTETRNLAWLTSRITDTVARADAIITDSQFSAKEICDRLSVGTDRVFPIHLGISDRFSPAPPERISLLRKALGLDRPYLLTVSTVEPRKNIEFLIAVFERMVGFDGHLVVAGALGWKYQPIMQRMKRSKRARDIRFVEYISDDDLPALYSGAELFLFPSLYEGFGLPPLEAMSCGTAVMASDAGSLPEVLGEAALLIGNFDPDEWASEAARLNHDGAARRVLTDKGRSKAAGYKWHETARKTWEVYRKTAL